MEKKTLWNKYPMVLVWHKLLVCVPDMEKEVGQEWLQANYFYY